jgi:primosomal protein N'
MLSVLVTAPEEADAARAARDIAAFAAAPDVGRTLKINGPTQDTIGRIDNRYRQVIFIQSDNINELIDIQNRIEKMINVDKYPEVVVNLDLS